MGYFSNGTEGGEYFEKYCARCRHMPGNPEDGGCAVWLAHLLYSYQLCNEPENPLNILIPRRRDNCGNDQCTMFLARTEGPTEDGGRTRADIEYLNWKERRAAAVEDAGLC